MDQHQTEVEHARAKVGFCPFCQTSSAELWYDPTEQATFRPFQVRCSYCGARGPWADCGWESAVPAWDMIARSSPSPGWRGPGSDDPDPHDPMNDEV